MTDVKPTDDSMEAVLLKDVNELEFDEVPVPEYGPLDALCRVRAVSICGTDPHIVNGDHRPRWPRSFPFILGHEWAGEIVELGDEAKQFGWAVGDRVAGTSHDSCGQCRMCLTGRYNLCDNYGRDELGHRQYGHYSNGAYARYVVHGIKSLEPLPDSLSYDEGALADPASISLWTIKRGRINAGDVVAVLGPGPIGLMCMMFAHVLGASRVIMVGRGERLETAEQLGAEVVDYENEDVVERVQELTDGKGAHLTVDAAGTKNAVLWATQMVRKGGNVVLTGLPEEDVVLPLEKIVLEEINLYGLRANQGTLSEALALMANDRVDVSPLITHTFDLEDYGRAYEVFTERLDGALKVVMHP